MVEDNQAWIGLTDEVIEGEWRKPESDVVFNTTMDGNLFSWGPGEPNNGVGVNSHGQHCAYVGYLNPLDMDDTYCSLETKTKLGLCEIKLPED